MNLQIEYKNINNLSIYVRNPKNHSESQVDKIIASIEEFGFLVPVLIDSKCEIIAGAGRFLAAKKMGMDVVPIIPAEHLTEDQVRAFRIADNKLAESEWLEDDLRIEMLDLKSIGLDLSILGFNDKEINQLLYLDTDGKIGKTDPDAVPDPPEEPVSKPGCLWQCGDHRIFCGDSTSPHALSALMQGKKSDMVFTDPPYLMNFEGSMRGDGSKSFNSKHGVIANDKMSKSKGREFLKKVCKSIRDNCDGAFYICFYRLGIDWILSAMSDVGLQWRSQIIWKKNQFTLSNSDYKSKYEPIIVGWHDDYRPIFYGWNMIHEWYARKNEHDIWEIELPSVWEVDRTKKNDLHPTMKPVELVERAVLNSSRPGGVVLDLFSGSGSTMIACERRDRICYAMELEPKYCDVTVRRWEEFTGNKAELISNE